MAPTFIKYERSAGLCDYVPIAAIRRYMTEISYGLAAGDDSEEIVGVDIGETQMCPIIARFTTPDGSGRVGDRAQVCLDRIVELTVTGRGLYVDVPAIVRKMTAGDAPREEPAETSADPEPCGGIAGVVHECRCRMNGGDS